MILNSVIISFRPSVPSYSARVNTLPPLKAEAQKANHTSSLLPNNQPLPVSHNVPLTHYYYTVGHCSFEKHL